MLLHQFKCSWYSSHLQLRSMYAKP